MLQKIQGVNRTAATLGLLPYSMIAKNKGHQQALEEELHSMQPSRYQKMEIKWL